MHKFLIVFLVGAAMMIGGGLQSRQVAAQPPLAPVGGPAGNNRPATDLPIQQAHLVYCESCPGGELGPHNVCYDGHRHMRRCAERDGSGRCLRAEWRRWPCTSSGPTPRSPHPPRTPRTPRVPRGRACLGGSWVNHRCNCPRGTVREQTSWGYRCAPRSRIVVPRTNQPPSYGCRGGRVWNGRTCVCPRGYRVLGNRCVFYRR